MERMDRIRLRAGVVWVASGVLAMVVWTAGGAEPGVGPVTWAVVAALAAAITAQLGPPRTRWWAARLGGSVIGVLLLGAVGDRFGVLGAPGDPGVSWGDWAHFRAETAELVPWSSMVPAAAVTATALELVLGALLVVGWQARWTGKLAAGLFAVYLIAMIPGMGFGSLLQFGVPVLIGGCLVASARGRRPVSDDRQPRSAVVAAAPGVEA